MTKTTKEKIFNKMPLTHLCKGKNCIYGCEDVLYEQSDFDQLRKELKDEMFIIGEKKCSICNNKTLAYHQRLNFVYCRKCFIDLIFNKFKELK